MFATRWFTQIKTPWQPKKKTGTITIHPIRIAHNPKLKLGIGNAKLSKKIGTFSLPAGHSCPFAKDCLSKANRLTGKIIDGKHCRFRCFAASQEAVYPTLRQARWHNFDLLREAGTSYNMVKLIQKSLSELDFYRVHVSGDYWKESYFLAWLNVAYNNPTKTFYGYTKATPFLAKYRSHLPPNFRFTASKGGTCDNLIAKHNLKSAEVVFSVNEAESKGLEIDHDDSYAIGGTKSFALLLHGTQPPGTEASKAWVKLMRDGMGGYGDNNTFRKASIAIPEPVMYITLNQQGRIQNKGFNFVPKPKVST